MKNISVTALDLPQYKEITVLTVKGTIDTITASDFEKTFQSALAEKKFKLILDLKEVSYISSAGWGIFVGEIKRIRTQKGDLFLVGMRPEVAEVYDLLQFSSILKAFPTIEMAVQKGFGRVRPGRGAAKAVAERIPETLPAEKALVTASVEQAPAGFEIEDAAPKRRWFEVILKPWKWF